MKVQLRRWFAIGLTSGALAVSMLAGSGAVGAAPADTQSQNGFSERRDTTVSAIAPTDPVVIVIPSNVATSIMSTTYLDNR